MKIGLGIIIAVICLVGTTLFVVNFRTPPIHWVSVNLDILIHEKAKSLAQKNMDPNQIQKALVDFKEDLMDWLDDFGKENKFIVANSALVRGNIPDKTPEFIRYYNGE